MENVEILQKIDGDLRCLLNCERVTEVNYFLQQAYKMVSLRVLLARRVVGSHVGLQSVTIQIVPPVRISIFLCLL